MGHAVFNRIDMVIDKDKLDSLKDARGFSQYKDLWAKMVERHPIGLNYKSFMNLLSNLVTWRLVYAFALSDTLGVSIYEMFKVIEVSPTEIATTPNVVAASQQGLH